MTDHSPSSSPSRSSSSSGFRSNLAIQTACFDIETSSLDARFGIILCAVVKPDGGKPVVFRSDELNKKWKTNRSDDSAIVLSLVDELSNYDILVAHNGVKFDLPFIRTRMVKWGFRPPFPYKKVIDPYQLVRNRFRLSNASLEAICDYLNLGRKTPVDADIWVKAALDGCKKSMDYIVDHCVKDVLLLEQVLRRVKDYITEFNQRGSGW